MDLEMRQRTNVNRCRLLGWQNIKVFGLPGRECSAYSAVVPETWSNCKVHRALGVPSPEVYSYLSDVYCRESDALLSIGRMAEAKYMVLSLGAFLRPVQHGPARCLAHYQVMGACFG